jgi:hypothetical protein
MIEGERRRVMNIRLALSIVTVAGSLAACAPAPLTKADVDGQIVCNADRMADVERAARREHKDVRWLHCPQATLRVAS